MSKIAKYPAVFSRILLTTPADGTPLEIPLRSEGDAEKTRLQFYNFLKFLRRNPREAVHFGNRHNEVMIRVQGSVIIFQTKVVAAASLEAGLAAATEALAIPVADAPPSVLGELEGLDFEIEETPDPADPLAILNRHLEKNNATS